MHVCGQPGLYNEVRLCLINTNNNKAYVKTSGICLGDTWSDTDVCGGQRFCLLHRLPAIVVLLVLGPHFSEKVLDRFSSPPWPAWNCSDYL